MISIELKKNDILSSRSVKKSNDRLVGIVKVGLEQTPNQPTTTDNTAETKSHKITLATKLGVTAFTTAVIVSPPVAGYYVFGKTGLVLGVLAAIPLAIVGGLVMIPVWLVDSY